MLCAFDTETHLIQPGNLTPKLVVGSFAREKEGIGWLCLPKETLRDVRNMLRDGATLVTHNGFYDFGVLCHEEPSLYPLVFRAYNEGRIRDTRVRQQLIDIRNGRLGTRGTSLADLEKLYLGRDRSAEKHDPNAWRLNYHKLDGVPLEQWPEDARRYAFEDAQGTMAVYDAQEALAPIAGELEVTRSNWALHLMSCHGIRTDREAVAKLKAELEAQRFTDSEILRGAGFYRLTGSKKALVEGRGTWSKDMAAIRERVQRAYNGASPKTDKGQVSTDRDTLERSGDPLLGVLAKAGATEKLLTTYVPVLERGVEVAILPQYGIAESIRTTCSAGRDGPDGLPLGCNIQNMPRFSAVREAFVPRPGFYFVSVDYDTLELRALSQVCLNLFGASKMADAIRAGKDLHLEFAAQILGISYDEAKARKGDKDVKQARQFGKIFNFGKPGGLGVDTLIEFARISYGTEMSRDTAERLSYQWLRAWPEMKLYFRYISDLVGDGTANLTSFGSGVVRGDVGYTAACNHYFQNLAAQGAREACFRVAREAYTDCGTPLFGCRPVAFIHDEILAEVPVATAHEAALRLSDVMCEAMRGFIPDLPITASPALMERWLKGAEPVYSEGKLVPWKPS